jgi:hypothetical protein
VTSRSGYDARLERADISAPIVFTLPGALLAVTGLADAPSDSVALKPVRGLPRRLHTGAGGSKDTPARTT